MEPGEEMLKTAYWKTAYHNFEFVLWIFFHNTTQRYTKELNNKIRLGDEC